jgi:NAD(P)-dependent dehydrogenase (short-subunit alcohol dehydrogenase family)
MDNVLITGCSSGIGRATAVRLQREGHRVFAGVREEHEVADLTEELRSSPQSDAHVLVLDVTETTSIKQAVDEVTRAVGDHGLDALVNNAGEGFPGPLETLPLDQIRAQLEVNLLGQIAVTQAALPLLRCRGAGRVLFVGSIGGKVSFGFAGPYHASKFAIEAVAAAWRQELSPDGISVSVIEPGPMSTGIWSGAIERVDDQLSDPDPRLDRYRPRLEELRDSLHGGDQKGSDPDQVAKVIQEALTTSKPAAHYPVGLPAKVISAVRELIPERVWDRLGRRVAG